MKIEEVKISELKSYAKNARLHSNKQIDLLAENIKRFSFTTPVLIDKNNEIIAGHGRIEALKKLNWLEVPCVRMENLTDEEIRSLRLADNKLAELATWDMDLAIEELKGLDDELMNLTGFDDYLLSLNNVEDVELSFDEVGVITLMPPESPKLKEKAILYCDKIDNYKKIKEAILDKKLSLENILSLI